MALEMLKKRLGLEIIERDWKGKYISSYFKISSPLIIPEGCVRIGKSAFRYCLRLKKVKISKNVKEIGNCAFWGCTKLKKVKIPENIERIGEFAFGKYSKVEVEYVKEETGD